MYKIFNIPLKTNIMVTIPLILTIVMYIIVNIQVITLQGAVQLRLRKHKVLYQQIKEASEFMERITTKC
jgi:hypothetical protein